MSKKEGRKDPGLRHTQLFLLGTKCIQEDLGHLKVMGNFAL